MKTKSHIILALIFGLILSTVSSPCLAFQEQEKTGIVYIPTEVKTVLLEGLQTQEPRLDIPFSIIKNLYLPAQQNMQSIFIFKVKNADLGFSSSTPIGEVPEKKEEKEEVVSSFEATPSQLQAHFHVFLIFKQLDGAYEKEIYLPFNLQVDGTTYEPEKEEIFTTSYPLPPGNYMLAMAITSQNLQKIGTQYLEFSLPNAFSFIEELDTTPLFFARNITRVQNVETTVEIHKRFFPYAVLQIEPNLENIFTAGENLDIFFFIFGAAPNETQRYDIDVTYEVVRGEEKFIRYAATKYDSPIISQPLPLKRTVLVKSTEEGETTERRESRDLEAGAYTLNIDIKDNISGKTLKKSIDFEFK